LWTMLTTKKSKYVDRIYLSTDSKKINDIAKKNGFSTEVLRKKKFSQSNTITADLVVNILKNIKEKYDYFVLLQPTSPLRQTRDIDNSLRQIIKKNGNSLVSTNKSNKKINGAIYIQKTNYFLKKKKFNNKNILNYSMPRDRSIDIDTIEDFNRSLNKQ